MIRTALASLVLIATSVGAMAAPPDMSDLPRKEQHALLLALVRANVAGVNCAGYEISDSEWKFITDAADQLAGNLGLSTDDYDARYYKPAFDGLDADPEFCPREGVQAPETLQRVLAIGGSIDKYKIEG